MLRKMLRYDLKNTYRTWLIMDITSLILTIVSGICINIAGKSQLEGLYVFVVLAFFAVFILLAAPYVTALYDFYRKLYTDEGYLTFTLPLKKQDLLSAKLIYCLISFFQSVIVFIINTIAFIIATDVLSYTSGSSGVTVIPETFVILPLGILIGIFSAVAITIFVFIIISISSRFSKIGRGVFVGVVMYAVMMIFFIAMINTANLSNDGVLNFSDLIPEEIYSSVVSVFMLALAVFTAMLSVVLYTVEYRIIDRHLNLS